MRSKVVVVAALSALGIWYGAGVSAVFGQSSPPAPTVTATATPPAAPPPASAGEAPPSIPVGQPEADDSLPRDVRDKLTGQQIYDILSARARGEEPPAVAIIVPVAVFLVSFAIVAVGFYTSLRKDRLRHETLRLLIERGGDIPPELLGPRPKRHSDLRRGIVLTAGGLGLAIVLAATVQEKGVWTAGLVPILLGLGYLLVWRLDPSQRPDEHRTPSAGET